MPKRKDFNPGELSIKKNELVTFRCSPELHKRIYHSALTERRKIIDHVRVLIECGLSAKERERDEEEESSMKERIAALERDMESFTGRRSKHG